MGEAGGDAAQGGQPVGAQHLAGLLLDPLLQRGDEPLVLLPPLRQPERHAVHRDHEIGELPVGRDGQLHAALLSEPLGGLHHLLERPGDADEEVARHHQAHGDPEPGHHRHSPGQAARVAHHLVVRVVEVEGADQLPFPQDRRAGHDPLGVDEPLQGLERRRAGLEDAGRGVLGAGLVADGRAGHQRAPPVHHPDPVEGAGPEHPLHQRVERVLPSGLDRVGKQPARGGRGRGGGDGAPLAEQQLLAAQEVAPERHRRHPGGREDHQAGDEHEELESEGHYRSPGSFD